MYLGGKWRIARRIVSAIIADVGHRPRHALELCSGAGGLTRLLAEACDRVTAVETHVGLVKLLRGQVSAETSINGPVSLITPRVFSERDAYVVRGAIRVDPSLSTLGPNLVVDDFSHVASCAEPCRVRKHEGRIIDDHVDGRRVVLCDFLGRMGHEEVSKSSGW